MKNLVLTMEQISALSSQAHAEWDLAVQSYDNLRKKEWHYLEFLQECVNLLAKRCREGDSSLFDEKDSATIRHFESIGDEFLQFRQNVHEIESLLSSHSHLSGRDEYQKLCSIVSVAYGPLAAYSCFIAAKSPLHCISCSDEMIERYECMDADDFDIGFGHHEENEIGELFEKLGIEFSFFEVC